MKRFSGILVLIFCFIAQAIATDAPKEIYTIQIGSFTEPEAVHFQFLAEIGMVYLEEIPDSKLQRVFVSKFENKKEADVYLKKVQEIGYKDAFIATRTIDDKKIVKTIQLGSYTIGEKIDLSDAKTLGKVYTHIKENEVRILIGFFPDITSAKIALDKARTNGFPSAFMKDTDMVWLQPVGSFEEAYLGLGKMVEKATPKPEITGVPNIDVPNPTPKPNPISTPDVITTNISTEGKASVAGLQAALKGSKKYEGEIDGVYNSDIKNSLKAFQENDEMYQLYETRTKDAPKVNNEKGDVTTLQGNIELIEFNPTLAAENLQKFEHPLAKVYTAYLYFTGAATAPSGREIDFLMNDAITQAYTGFSGDARFNYQQKYKYNDVQTLIQHLAYVSEVTTDNPKIPCWMVQKHNNELSQAFAGLKPPSFTDCEGFETIKEVRILQAMAQDMDLLSDVERLKKHEAEKQAYIARRTELYLNPNKISLPEQELYAMWNTNLWNAVERNIKADPLRKDILTTFKVTYFLVYDKLENHYKLQDFGENQSKTLALATLYALVNYNLGDYITNEFED